MPMMVLNRNHSLFVGIGTVTFKKGEPVSVPDYMVAGAMAAGAIAVNEKEAKAVEKAIAVEENKPIPEGNQRKLHIMAVMREIRAINNPEQFTATGLPNEAALASALGYPIGRKERDEIWKSIIEEVDA